MPPDEKILKLTGLQKIKNRYQDKNKNEVKLRGQIPVNLDYGNNKQKMEIWIIEKTDITPLLGIVWKKKFKLTIGRIQLAENNQSEREKVFNKIPDLFEYFYGTEKKYSISELELLAVVWGLEKFRFYVYGKKVHLYTDHQALEPLNKRNRCNKQNSTRLTQWLDRLTHCDISIQHIAGSILKLTDYLS